jgi:hypothetical protein
VTIELKNGTVIHGTIAGMMELADLCIVWKLVMVQCWFVVTIDINKLYLQLKLW